MDWRRLLGVVAVGALIFAGWRLVLPGPPAPPDGPAPPGVPAGGPGPEEQPAPAPEPLPEAAKAGWNDALPVSHEGSLGELLDWLEGEVAFALVLDRTEAEVAERLGKPFQLAGIMTPGNILGGVAEMARFDLVVVHDGNGVVAQVEMAPGSGKITVQTP